MEKNNGSISFAIRSENVRAKIIFRIQGYIFKVDNSVIFISAAPFSVKINS